MPEIQIRPALPADIPILVALDHHYTSDHVWQIELHHEGEENQVSINFRQVRLPRSMKVEYPRSPRSLETNWAGHSGILVAVLDKQVIGFASLMLGRAPFTTWVTDLVVERRLRRQGIGSALLLAALEWSLQMETHNLVLEMEPKNYPAIQLALKLGFDFCGFNDRYYGDHKVGIFFRKSLH